MGLFWSMELAAERASGQSTFSKSRASPHSVKFSAEAGGHIIATAQLKRQFLAPGTRVRDLTPNVPAGNNGASHAPSCVARLFIPPESAGIAPFPAVVVLGGSGGGFNLDKTAVLSRHGFATLALAYFGIPPLPAWLHRIPLDYFEAALVRVGAQPEIDARRVGVLGVSRGAEFALLLAANFPQVVALDGALAPEDTLHCLSPQTL
jgi:pimeloyl-ACP methyl ester carboxylesterase